MKNQIKTLLLTFGISSLFIANPSFAQEQPSTNQQEEIEELTLKYRRKITETPENVRKEIIHYRQQMIALNKQKIEVYKKLSQQAQQFLKEQQQYKKKVIKLINQQAAIPSDDLNIADIHHNPHN